MSVFFLSSFFLSLSLSHRHSSSSFSSTALCFHSEKRGLSLFLFILLYPSLPVSCQLLPATPCHRLLFGISQSAPRRWRNHTFVCPAPISLVWPQLFFFAKKKVIVLRHLFLLANKNSSASRLTCEFVHLNAKYRSRIELELSRRHLARFYPRYLISPSRGYFKIAAGNHGLSWLDRWVLFNGSFALAREEVRRRLFLVFIFFSVSPGYWKEFPDNFQAGVKVSSLLTFWEQPTAVHL